MDIIIIEYVTVYIWHVCSNSIIFVQPIVSKAITTLNENVAYGHGYGMEAVKMNIQILCEEMQVSGAENTRRIW